MASRSAGRIPPNERRPMVQPLRRRRRRSGLWPVAAGVLIRIGLVCAGLVAILFAVGELDRARLGSGVRPTTGSSGAAKQIVVVQAPERPMEPSLATAALPAASGGIAAAPPVVAPMAAPSLAPSEEARSTPASMPLSGVTLSPAALPTPSLAANGA